jgi:hypothetical protein
LHGILHLIAGKDDSKSSAADEKKAESQTLRENLLKEKDNRIVFINPMTMVACGLSILRPTVINRRHILLAWPDSGLPLTTVAVSDWAAKTILVRKPKDVLVISNLKGIELSATEVHFRPRYVTLNIVLISFISFVIIFNLFSV